MGGAGFTAPVDKSTMSGFTCYNITDTYNTGGGIAAGADPNGILDSAPAISHWLSQGSGYIYAPPGTYLLKSKVSWGVSHAHLFGAGFGATFFKADPSYTGYLFESLNLRDNALTHCTITATSTRTAGYAVHINGGDSTVGLSGTSFGWNGFLLDVDMDSQYNGVLVDDGSGSVGCWSVTLGTGRHALWRDFATAGTAISLNSPLGASHVIKGIFVKCENASAMAAGINVVGSGDFKVLECDTLGVKNGFLLNNSGNLATQGGSPAASLGLVANCEFDNTEAASGSDCFRVVPTSTAGTLHMQISNSWFASGYNGAYINLNGSTPAGWRFTFTGCTFVGNNQYGLHGTNGATQDTGSGGSIQIINPGNSFDGNGVGQTSFA